MKTGAAADVYLGVDGGQSGMRAWIADGSGQVIGKSVAGGPTSPTDGEAGPERFAIALQSSVESARWVAGLADDTVFAAACLGFSGGPDDKDALARSIVAAKAYLITDDARVALTGATGGGPGIVTIAGTGSISFGRNAAGQTARAGGWGYAFGDEGSAFDLARQALRTALREEEGWGRAAGALSGGLREALLADTGARDVNDLVHRFYRGEFSRARIAALAQVVEAVALRGDAAAQELLGAAAQSLAVLAGAVRRMLFTETEAVDVRYAGGVFRCQSIQARFQMLTEMDGRTRVAVPIYCAAGGALLEAFRLGGVECSLRSMPEAAD